MVPRDSIVRATLLALLKPKRLLPMLVVCIPLVAAQIQFSRDALAAPIAMLMCLSVLLAPVAYRVLFPEGLDFSHGAIRLMLYALVGAGVVLSIGAGVPKLLNMAPTFMTSRASLGVSIALFLVAGWGLGRDIGFEKRVARLQEQAQRAQLLALKSHLDPHFLFNTLNAIAEWCRTDGAVAEKAVLQLSDMLRTMLEGVQAPLWPLDRELQLVDTLLALHQLRDAALFTVTRDLKAPGSIQVPPMALLTLAENAVKHGPAKGHRGVIHLHSRVEGSQCMVVIENPGPVGAERIGSHGLPTLRQQLQLTWGPKATLSLEAGSAASTRAVLTFPS